LVGVGGGVEMQHRARQTVVGGGAVFGTVI